MTTPHDTHHQAPDGPAALALYALALVANAAIMSVILYQAVSIHIKTSMQDLLLDS